ncbi:uncharacterized protein [Diabrotica undecimpunctata]|uniref:uncharacterized protein isoform X2 n=1 Tax=Diabrotica undecimpunctata TaxID=50387 RepID=UPI003B640A98
MEFKVEVKEDFFECSERYLGSQLHRSTNNIETCKDKPDDKPEIEIKAEIKNELAQDEQGYNIESQLPTSFDLGDLKNEPDEDNSGARSRHRQFYQRILSYNIMDSSNYSFEEDTHEIECEVRQEEVPLEELLIQCVQARPALWNCRMALQERSKGIREKLWTEIFEEFGSNPEFSIEYLTKKWRNLRDTYIRLKGEYTPSGSSAKKKKKWVYYDYLSFLNDSIGYKPMVSNVKVQSKHLLPSDTDTVIHNTVKQNKNDNIEVALIDTLQKINAPAPSPTVPSPAPVNPICSRISDLLSAMPQKERTCLEIKLLSMTFEGAKDYL